MKKSESKTMTNLIPHRRNRLWGIVLFFHEVFLEIFFRFREFFENGRIVSRTEFLRKDFENEIPFVSSVREFYEEAFEGHISFSGEKLLFVPRFIGQIDIVNTVSEKGKCFDEIRSAFGIDMGNMKRCFSGYLFDEREGCIFVFRDKKKKGFWLYIDDGDIEIFVALLYLWKILGKPAPIFIESVWRIKIHGLAPESLRHFYDGVHQFRGHTAFISSNAHNRDFEFFGKSSYICGIFRIEIERIQI